MVSRALRPAAVAMLLAWLPLAALAASEQTPAENPVLGELRLSEPEATLVISNRPIVTFRAAFGARTPARRVKLASERIQALPHTALTGAVDALPVKAGDVVGVMIAVDGRYVFAMAEADVDPEAGESFDALVAQTLDHLRGALHARAEQRETRVLLRGLAQAGPATLIFLVFAWLISRARSWIARWASAASADHLQKISRLGFDVRRQASRALSTLANGLTWILLASVGYVWLTVCFSAFPYTEPWGDQLGDFLRDTLFGLARGMVNAVPSLLVIALIVLITRAAIGLINAFFRNVERGATHVSWLDAQTARATRQLINVILWLFAITVAYPHIPGSQTDAFRGISVFVGIVVSLGSTGVVNQVMSGLVVIYSRTLRPGDWVRVGEIEGLVKEVGMLTTKLSTVRREEVAIPNAVLVGRLDDELQQPGGRGRPADQYGADDRLRRPLATGTRAAHACRGAHTRDPHAARAARAAARPLGLLRRVPADREPRTRAGSLRGAFPAPREHPGRVQRAGCADHVTALRDPARRAGGRAAGEVVRAACPGGVIGRILGERRTDP